MRRRAADVKRRKWVMAPCDGAHGAGVAPATALCAGLSDEDVAFPTNTSEAALVAFADPSGLWLLVARHVAPAGGDAVSKLPDTVGFLVTSQCMWVRASALVSQAPVLPGHSTDGVRPPHGALGPAVFVLELL